MASSRNDDLDFTYLADLDFVKNDSRMDLDFTKGASGLDLAKGGKADLDFSYLNDLDFTRTLGQAREELGRAGVAGARVPTPGSNARCRGEIVAASGGWVAQGGGGEPLTLHRSSNLSRTPEIGAEAVCAYRGGKACVFDRSKALDEALEKARICRPPEKGRVDGKIVGIDDKYAWQEGPGGTLVAHRLENLERVPEMGVRVEIAYDEGLAEVKDRQRPMLQERGQERAARAV